MRVGGHPKHYILICIDGLDIDDRKVPAFHVANVRLASKSWPLYKRTGFVRSFSQGDKCLIYVGGSGPVAQCFIGDAVVQRVVDAPSGWTEADGTIISNPASKLIEFSKATIWDEPVSIRDYLDDLTFIKNRARWGPHLMGGTKSIPSWDYALIYPA